jgi:hypothetical protein
MQLVDGKPAWKKDPTMISVDEHGNQWIPGECECDGVGKTLLDLAVKEIVQLLSFIDNILCAIMLTVLKTVVEVGIMFIPGVGEEVRIHFISGRAVDIWGVIFFLSRMDSMSHNS